MMDQGPCDGAAVFHAPGIGRYFVVHAVLQPHRRKNFTGAVCSVINTEHASEEMYVLKSRQRRVEKASVGNEPNSLSSVGWGSANVLPEQLYRSSAWPGE